MGLGLAKDIRRIPNLITLSRIVLMAIGVGLYFAGQYGVGLAVAVVAALTDYVDGIVARATGQVTRLGEILDQFADLFFESIGLTMAIHHGFLPHYVILIYVFREFWTLSVRRYMAGQRKNIPSSIAGKAKTNFLMWGFLPSFLSIAGAAPSLEPALGTIGKAMIWIGLGLSWVSGIGYTRAFVRGYESEPPATRGVPQGLS
jgi:CDP-diacylglycerol--glycerol-3-phosphate 3-phosphatidyltransferase/cardiolipin synthase